MSHQPHTPLVPSRPRSPRRRRTLLAGGLAAGLLAVGLTGGAQAGPVHGADQRATHPTERVRDFYLSYLTARGENDRQRARKLRADHLTGELREQLTAWEKKHHADGVTRAQNVPVGARTTTDGSGAGHSWVVVTLEWDGSSPDGKLHVQTDNASGRISDIKRWSR
ncbi:hypothetical protein [Streptomyces sp. NPDC005438]|uniref:hypothetical protein n=1 Tax=Streptomyces sp. NPDC005438 TaxID=3156880 RepID=UPI0033BB9052